MDEFHTGIQVADAMTTKPISILGTSPMMNAIKTMSKERIGSLLVMKGTELSGIVTERDLIHKLARGLTLNQPVERFMTPRESLITIEPHKDIYEAMIEMREHGIRHLPVIENHHILGFLTAKDILKIEPDLFDIMAERFEIREPERKPLNREEE